MDAASQAKKAQTITIAASVVLLGALVLHILSPILAWQWVRRPFLGFLLDQTLTIVAVRDRWKSSPHLRRFDRLQAIDGTPVRRHRDLERRLETWDIGTPVDLTLSSNTAAQNRITVHVTTMPGSFPLLDLIILFVIPYAIGLCYLVAGAWVLYRGPLNLPSQIFAALSAIISIALSTSFDVVTTHALVRVWYAAIPLSAAALAYFALSMYSEAYSNSSRRWPYLIPAGIVLPIIVWSQLTMYRAPMHAMWPHRLGIALLMISSTSFLILTGHISTRPSYVEARMCARKMLIGALVAFVPSILLSALLIIEWIAAYPHLVPNNQPPTVAILLLSAFPVSAILALPHCHSAKADLPPLYRDRRGHQITVRNFVRDLATNLDTQQILQKLLDHIENAFDPISVAIFVASESGTFKMYQARGDHSQQDLQTIHFTRRDRLVSELERQGECIVLTDRDLSVPHIDKEERSRLDRLQAQLLIPLRAKERLMGILAVGHLSSRDRYSTADRSLLNIMADQAAIAAENAQLYDQQLQQEQRLIDQTRRLTDILALGDQLKSLDRDIVAQSTVQAVYEGLGFEMVTLSLVEENDPARVRVEAWAGIDSAAWQRLASTSFPLIDFDAVKGSEKLEHSYFIYAPDSPTQISTPQRRVPWHDGDELFVLLTANKELLGYLTVDQPRSGYRPSDDTIEVLEIFANQAAIAVQNANLYASIDRALDERVAELATLQEIDTQLNVKLDFDYVMNMTLEWAMRITAATAGTLALVSPDDNALNVVAHKGYPTEWEPYWNAPWPIDESLTGQVVKSGKSQLVNNVEPYAEYAGSITSPRSHLAAPIKREGKVIGTISLESPQVQGFTIDHMSFLMRLADHAAIAIENVRLYKQSNQRVAELTALQQTSLDIGASLNLNAVLESVTRHTMELLSADETTIYLYDEHHAALLFGTELSSLGRLQRPPIAIADNWLTARVARTGQRAIIHDTNNISLPPGWDIGAIASIPLQKAGHVLGVFDITFDEPHYFASDELRALNLLADQAAMAIQNAQLFDQVQRASNAKNELISTVSRELRRPMTSIQGYARLMTLGAAGQVNAQQREFANTILKNVERMGNLVNNLLELARIESGRINISLRPIALDKTIQDAIRSIQDQIDASEHHLKVTVPADLPRVQADPARLMQVWINLISNACKFTPPRGHIHIWARQQTAPDSIQGDQNWILCAVEDNGVGITPESQELIFEQFYRVESPDTKDPGTGLGLPIARSIIELHGGHMWVESEPGRGSTFYFNLPAV